MSFISCLGRRVIYQLSNQGSLSVSSVTQLCLFLTPWTEECQVSQSITSSLNLAQTVRWVSEAFQISHPLSSPSPPASIFPSTRDVSNESAFLIRWPKYWSFSFSISPSNEYSGLISWGFVGLILHSKGLSRVFCNTTFQNTNSLMLSLLSKKAMTPRSSTLVWRILCMEKPGRLQSMALRVRHDWTTSLSLFTFTHWRGKRQPTPVFLPGESQGWGSLLGCRLWDHTESNRTEVT